MSFNRLSVSLLLGSKYTQECPTDIEYQQVKVRGQMQALCNLSNGRNKYRRTIANWMVLTPARGDRPYEVLIDCYHKLDSRIYEILKFFQGVSNF